MKTKNTILCSTLALILCSTVNALSFDTSISKDLLKAEASAISNALETKVASESFKKPSELAMQLIQAVKNDDEDTFDAILEEIDQQDINDQDSLGYTAFMWAARLGKKNFADKLFWYSDLNVQSKGEGLTALMLAIKNERREIIDLILNKIDNSYDNWVTDSFAVDLNLQNNNGWNALMYAIDMADKKTVKHMLSMYEYGAGYRVTLNPKELKKSFGDGTSFLIMAMKDRSGDIFNMILNAKDSEGNYRTDLNYVTEYGFTALTMELGKLGQPKEGEYPFVEKILEAKDDNGNYRMTNLNGTKFNENPLFNAIFAGHFDYVKMLVEAKDINGEYRINLNTQISENSQLGYYHKGDDALNIAMKTNKGEIAAYLAQVMTERKNKQ